MNPFSSLYYIRENKGRAALCIVMMFLGTLIMLTGNYVDSVIHCFDRAFEISDKLVLVGLQTTDEEFRDFNAFVKDVDQDPKLQHVMRSARGFSSLEHSTVLGLELTEDNYVFNSVEDMEKVFRHLGIQADLSACGDMSVVVSDRLARNLGIRVGDTLDRAFSSYFLNSYTVAAVAEDDSYGLFYVYEDNDNLGRLYIFSDSMEGEELYDYVRNLAGDRKVKVSYPLRNDVMPQMSIFYVIFYSMDILIAIVLAVSINSVVTGQYMKRTYEFGVYRALGRSRREIRRKVAAEILTMNLIAVLLGLAVILLFTYLINSLVYADKGLHLQYFSMMGLTGFAVCEVLILLPMILSRGRKMGKADVTEF